MDEQRGWIREHVLEAPRRRTLLWLFLAMTVVFGGSMGAFISFLVPLAELPVSTAVALGVVAGLATGLPFGVVMTLAIAWTWSQQGGAAQAERIARAIRSGRVPDGAEASTWDPVLARQETWARRGIWLFTIEFAVFAALSALLLTLPDAPSDATLPAWLPWVGLVFFGVMTVVNPLASLHRLRRVRALRAQLRRSDLPL